MVGTSQKWPAKAGGRSPKGPAVAGTTVSTKISDNFCTKIALVLTQVQSCDETLNISVLLWLMLYLTCRVR